MPKQLRETVALSERAAAEAQKTGRMLIQFISPGWGSSGYYSPDVLEAAATDRVIPKGTHMYADHPTVLEDQDRPERSVKDLIAVTTEDARLATDGALVGEVKVVPAWRDLLTDDDVREALGVSIRGSATDIVEGEAEGRRGGIIEGLVAPVMSVDFVTRAGRGGKVLSLLESAATNRRALGHGVAEATVNDTREALQQALRDAYGTGEGVWIYVRDFDESTVWFEVEGAGDDTGIYGQTYDANDGAVALTGERTEVRVSTTYVPVTRPDSTTTTATESQEDTMPKIQIEEADHNRLTEKAGRVDALESENATLKAENGTLKEADASRKRADRARAIVTDRAREAKVQFSPLEERGLIADLPIKEGDLDEAAFTTTVDEAAKALVEAAARAAENAGAGRVFGYGSTPTTGGGDPGLTEAELNARLGIEIGA